MRKTIIIGLIMIMILSGGAAFADSPNKTVADVGIGTVFLSDAMGLSMNFSFYQSLESWIRIVAPTFQFDLPNLMLGVKLGIDLFPLDFYYYSFSLELMGGYLLRLSDFQINVPINIFPYATIGLPINVYGSSSGTGNATGAFLMRIGSKVGYSISEMIEAGLGFEYKMNIGGYYIGSVGLALYCNFYL